MVQEMKILEMIFISLITDIYKYENYYNRKTI